jgi:acetyltransferase
MKHFTRHVDALFSPQSVALVGISEKPSFVGNIFLNLKKWQFEGPVHLVNPKYKELHGHPCHASVDAIPDDVGLVIIGVASAHVAGVLADCAKKRVGAVTVVSSGFLEQDAEEGRRRQSELTAWAQVHSIPINGPNCLGLMSSHNRMVCLPTPLPALIPGNIGAVVQSGMLAPSILMPLAARGIGVSRLVSLGNEADVDLADYINFLAEDPQTKVIVAYAEQIKRPAAFVAACKKAAETGTPIVMIKVGKSEGATRAALAHTGALVGVDGATDAMLRKLGVIRVDSVDDLIETAIALLAPARPRGNRVVLVSPSGGVSSLTSDLADRCGVRFPQPSAPVADALRKIIPAFGAVGNPLDATGQSVFDTAILEGTFTTLAGSGEYDAIIWVRDFAAGIDRESGEAKAIEAAASLHPDVPIMVTSIVGGHYYPSLRPGQEMASPTNQLNGWPFLQGGEASLKAMSSLIGYAAFERGQSERPSEDETLPRAMSSTLSALGKAENGILSESESMSILAPLGFRGPAGKVVGSPEEAGDFAASSTRRLVMKIASAEIPHKTDAGGVILNVSGKKSAEAAYRTIIANVSAHAPKARIDGVLMQEQVAEGVDMILGFSRDVQFGPVVAIGFGGVLVEALKDIKLLIPPFSDSEVRDTLATLRGAPLLEGVRGQPPCDIDALVAAIRTFGQLSAAAPTNVSAVEINPLRCLAIGNGVVALDALIIVGDSASDTKGSGHHEAA